ncbi:MAG: 30S ribosomal protein S20 [Actinomycetes bacterium]|nr:30S ribosomal protein S20 [Actinomycetes bacterium]
MANIKSQKKRNLTNEKARLRNKSVKSALKTSAKKVHEAIEAGDREAAIAAATETSKQLDVAVSKGVIHKNQAANRKSGLVKAANAVGSAEA